MSLPASNSIPRPSHTNLRMINIAKTDIEHQIPTIPLNNLAASHSFLLPVQVFVRSKDGILRVLAPVKTVRAGRIADRVRLMLASARVPHFIEFSLFIPKDVRTHQSSFFPWKLR